MAISGPNQTSHEVKATNNPLEKGLVSLRPLTEDYTARWGKPQTFISVLLLIVAVFSANFTLIQANEEKISIVDEWSYVDYIFQAAEGNIVPPGASISTEALDYLACHEVIGVGNIGSGCGIVQSPDDFPLSAKSPAEIHPPIYFLITAQIAKLVDVLVPSFNLIDSARLVGSLWLLIGLGVWLFVFKLLGVRLDVAISVEALVAFSPLVLSVTNFITPDATFALSSGVIFLCTVLWLRKKISVWWLFLAGLLPVAFKVTHLLAAFAAAALVFGIGYLQKNKTLKETIFSIGALLGGTAFGLIGWQLIRRLIRIAPSPVHPNEPWSISILSFAKELGYHISTLPQFPGSVLPVPQSSSLVVTFFGWLLLASALGGVLYLNRKSELWMLSAVSISTVFFGAAFLSLITVVLAGGFLIPEARYGLPFLFLWVLPLALVLRTRMLRIGIGLLAFASWIAVFIPV